MTTNEHQDKANMFFDSHGGLWAVCSMHHPEAKAFGPSGAAREVSVGEAERLGLSAEDGLFASAAIAGRVEEENEWLWLLPHPEEEQR